MREATGLSEGTCTNALGFLSDLGLLRSDAARGRASGRQVVEPDSLLDIYASESVVFGSLPTLSIGITWRVPIKDLVELGSRWTHEGVDWAVTGVTAASVIAPLLTTVSTMARENNSERASAAVAARCTAGEAARVGKLPAWVRFLIAIAAIGVFIAGYQLWLSWSEKKGGSLERAQRLWTEREAESGREDSTSLTVVRTEDVLQCERGATPENCGRGHLLTGVITDTVSQLICFKVTVRAVATGEMVTREFCELSLERCEDVREHVQQTVSKGAFGDCYILQYRD